MTLRWTVSFALLMSPAVAVRAQERFTTQVMVVPAFQGTDRGLAAKAADIVRARVSSAYPRQELRVVSGGDIEDWLRRSGFDENAQLSEGELKELAKKFRADERITGVATRIGGKNGRVRLDAELALVRDLRMSQPFSADGANVDEAADAVGRDAAAARRQLVPLRQCENAAREGRPAAAVTAATTAIAAYARAVPARICLLNALARLDASADSVIAVANAILSVAPRNPVALEALAQALDSQNKQAAAAPVWERLLATDSSNEELLDKVVNALARGGNAKRAEPLIDRGTDEHPDNLPLLKLRWLVHLATSDWKGATQAGERLLARDIAAQGDADFYSRLASAYRSDSQPARALSVAASGVAKFPKDAGVYITYLQMLRAENDAALPRGLTLFPESAELHVLAAQTLKSSGNSAGALEETRRALAANPRLPHGYLQLAQLEMDAGQIDSAFAHVEKAPEFGEDPATVSQFALARGNALYKAATASQKRDGFQLAMRFLSLAERLAPSAQAKFLLGASALSVSQSAATDAVPTKSCELSKLADSSLTDAEINLVAGGVAAPDAAKQFLEYVGKLRPYVSDQLKSFCPPAP
jgi:tetratricopeptide (TPR) repeat protein